MNKLLFVLALAGCSKDEAAPRTAPEATPKPVVVDAAPEPTLQLAAADAAVTLAPVSTAAIVLAADGSITWFARPNRADDLDLARLPASTSSDADHIAEAVAAAQRSILDARATGGLAGDEPCGFGFGRAGFGPGGGGDGWGTIGVGRYGTIGHGPTLEHAGLRANSLTGDYCGDFEPIILADARGPAAKLVDLLTRLPSATLAVTTDGGKHARMLSIQLLYIAGNLAPGDAAELGFMLGPDAVTGSAYRGKVADATAWSWTGELATIADGYHQGAATELLLGATDVRLRLDPALTAGALITALGNLRAGNVVHVGIGEPIDFQRQGGVGTRADAPVVVIAQPTITGAYDGAILRRYLRRNLPKLRYCYEKQLLAHPGLAGTVTATFTISPEGHVTQAGADGVAREVSDCIRGVIAAIELPKPKGGKPVAVTQTFDLRPAST